MLIKYEPFQAKNVLSRNETENILYSSKYVLNPYKGCPVDCRYCYVSKQKHVDSSALESKKEQIVKVKINIPYLLEKKLLSGLPKGTITIGESCEPYAPIEDKYFITQRLLEVLTKYDFPIHIVTRFPLVLRDLNILKQINNNNFACVTVSIPAVKGSLLRKLEGNSPLVRERLNIIKSLKKEKISAGIAVAPIFPFVSDGQEVERLLKKASIAGADYVLLSPLLIKDHQKKMIFAWIEEKYPEHLEKYVQLYSEGECPGGQYWFDFMEKIKIKVEEYGLSLQLPFKDEALNQEHLNFISNV